MQTHEPAQPDYTTAQQTALDNFMSFAEAWLCYPNCTTADLDWDYNNDNEINFLDWPADCNDFLGMPHIIDYQAILPILTDLRKSVVAIETTTGGIEEIGYNAWGTPAVAQNAELQGLSLFWNGYYLDSETENYYLRNRYYSPLERKFVTDDPRGINPNGNWNNAFAIQTQYGDGFGLQVFAGSDPVNNRDDWGLSAKGCYNLLVDIAVLFRLNIGGVKVNGVEVDVPGGILPGRDKFAHCYVSCRLAQECGRTFSFTIGMVRESIQQFGDRVGSIDDLIANGDGISYSRSKTGNNKQRCKCSCSSEYGKPGNMYLP